MKTNTREKSQKQSGKLMNERNVLSQGIVNVRETNSKTEQERVGALSRS